MCLRLTATKLIATKLTASNPLVKGKISEAGRHTHSTQCCHDSAQPNRYSAHPHSAGYYDKALFDAVGANVSDKFAKYETEELLSIVSVSGLAVEEL